MTKELSKEILKKLEDFCESVKTALEVTEPEKKCKSFEDVKFCATDKPDKILIVFRGDEKVTEILNDGPKRYIKIEGGINATIKQIGPLYSIDDKRVDASNYDTINKLVKEYEAKFDKNRGGYDCERGNVNNEEIKTCSFIFHEKARVIDVSTYWSNGVVYTIGNNGKNYTIERLNTSEFYYKGDIPDNLSSMKLKDIIIDYWHNKDL